MDNESRYFSLNSKNILDNSVTHNLILSGESICLDDRKNYIIDSAILKDSIGIADRIQEFILDNNGLIYILDDSANIWQYDYQRNYKELIIKQGGGIFTNEAKISCSEGIIYIADLKADNKISAFSINDSSVLWTMKEVDGFPLLPLDITADEKGNIYVLIPANLVITSAEEYEVLDSGMLEVLKIDEKGKLIQVYRDEDLKLQKSTKAVYLKNMVCLKVSKSGDIFILNSQTREVFGFNQAGDIDSYFTIEGPAFPSCLDMDSNNTLYIGEFQGANNQVHYNRSIFKFDKDGNQTGKIAGLMNDVAKISIDRRNNIFTLDREGNVITIFKLNKQMKESDIYKSPHGTLITCSLDSTVSETNWHKYVVDASIPEDTQLKISYFAREEKDITLDNKKVDIDKFIMDDSIPFEYKLQVLEGFWCELQVNPNDSLTHGASGRYFWIKIEFIGSKGNTPYLNKIRVYYPRISYLRYLPLVYQEDPGSRDFLERYLCLFETFFSDIDEKISNISKYFDIDYVSGPFLRWISEWMKITTGDEWEDYKLRKLVKNAVDIYKLRGTKGSIERIIEIYTGEKPLIIENFELDRMMGESEIKELVSSLYGIEHNSFCVLIRSQVVKSAKQQLEIEKIINSEKPAFTEAKLIILSSNIRLDMHSYLGLNSYLPDVSLLHLNGKAAISDDIAIAEYKLHSTEDKLS